MRHVSQLMVCRYGAERLWSTARVKVMGVRVDAQIAVKDGR
jgi:hypothetical protein